jgi:tetratricopeptide (TPR) repeat protein
MNDLIIFYVNKNYELALQKFNKSLEIDSDYTDSIRMKWMSLYKFGDPSESIGYLSDAIEKDKKNLLLYLELIEILEKEKRFDEAEKVKSLLKENTPKARPNMKWYSFDFSQYPNPDAKYSIYKKALNRRISKRNLIKEKFNYYKLLFRWWDNTVIYPTISQPVFLKHSYESIKSKYKRINTWWFFVICRYFFSLLLHSSCSSW